MIRQSIVLPLDGSSPLVYYAAHCDVIPVDLTIVLVEAIVKFSVRQRGLRGNSWIFIYLPASCSFFG